MKDRLIQIRADAEFLSKLEYLQAINGFKSTSETIRKIVEKEWRKEHTMKELLGGKDVHDFCIKCDKSAARMIDGERFVCCDGVPVISMGKCPYGKWKAKETYLIVSND